jgi:hypothetical protein
VGNTGAGGVNARSVGASGDDGKSLGAISVEVDGVSPRPGDDAGGFLQDWVTCGTVIHGPESTTLGDVTPSPGSSDVTGPRGSGLLLPGSPGFPPLPID